MEGPRFLLAILLSVAVVIAVQFLFPTTPARGPAVDTVVEETVRTTAPERVDTPAVEQPRPAPPAADDDAEPPPPADTVWVENAVARYGISTRGAALVSVELLEFASYTRDGPVQLAEPEAPEILSYAVRAGNRVVALRELGFTPSAALGDTLRVMGDTVDIRFAASAGGTPVEIVYTFVPNQYLVGVEGRVGAVAGGDATLLLGLGPRLAVNEADSAEDLRALGYVVNARRTGIRSVALQRLEQDRIEEGPLSWVALKNKYFLAAVLPSDRQEVPFGGLLAEHGPGGVESVRATLPLTGEGAFGLRLFFGPQEYSRLSALGAGLEDVNPYGWRIFRPIIRPLAHLITWMLEGLHDVLNLGYGWVLILFGFGMRGLMWPLNAKAMRSQLKTMELQPRIKEIQAKYKEKPELLQKEMLRLYKEEGFNPLGGCLPMLIPWPVLITLFFVFQNTIEFRGVDFWWLPDLSRPDPFYLLPVLLGLSLFVTQWMNLRVTPQQNAQQKMLLWFMPIMMVVIFLNFASGLNLYYAASNVAGIPQQIQIIGERRRARERITAKAEA